MTTQATTRLFLVRHGATQLSAEDRFAGAVDVELSDEGKLQAGRLAERLADDQITAAYCSPMKRTVHTASILAGPHSLALFQRDGLREINHGHWEGMRRADVESQFPEEYAAWEQDPFTFAPAGGEAGVNVIARALPVIREIVLEHRGQNVLIVSHKATLRLTHQQPARLRRARLPRPARPIPGLLERTRFQGPGAGPVDVVQRCFTLPRPAAAFGWAVVQMVGRSTRIKRPTYPEVRTGKIVVSG